MNCGNLSRSIQDHEQKNYEKNTVSFVSKHIEDQKASQAPSIFKHLKNAAMGGSDDFFKNSTSVANKK